MHPEKVGKSGAWGEIRHNLTRGKVVPMGDIFLMREISEFCGRGYLTEDFDVPCVFTQSIGDGVADGCAAHILITIILEFLEPGRTFVQGIDDLGVFVGVSEERVGGLRIHEQGSELGGGNLKSDFRELLGVVFAQVIGEMVLEVGKAELVFLLCAPFFVTTASAPVGDIAFGDGDAAVFKGPDDFRIGNIIVKEFVDHVAFESWQAGDFSVAHALAEVGGRRGRDGDDALG